MFKILSMRSNIMLVYHASYNVVPNELIGAIHNVKPNNIVLQLRELSRFFKFVDVETFCQRVEDGSKGYACVTFDDGYPVIFENIVPRLLSENIPICVFVSDVFLGKVFWRDKLRLILRYKAKSEKLSQILNDYFEVDSFRHDNLYAVTKNPVFSSRKINQLLDSYISEQRLQLNDIRFDCTQLLLRFKQNTLFSVGLHTSNHYVMSSLSKIDQETEIMENFNSLSNIGFEVKGRFCLPFGGSKDFNLETLELLQKSECNKLFLSRNDVNLQKKEAHGISIYERIMPRDAPTFPLNFSAKLLLKGLIS